MIRHYCDKCNKEIESGEERRIEISVAHQPGIWKDKELCKDCLNQIRELLDEWFQS